MTRSNLPLWTGESTGRLMDHC